MSQLLNLFHNQGRGRPVGKRPSGGGGGGTPYPGPDWSIAGGVDPLNVVAVYQAKGAADYATSKINLANPGVHDLTDGAAIPTFDAATGWTFNGTTTYLMSDITNLTIGRITGSVIAKYSNVSGTAILLGSYKEAATYATDYYIKLGNDSFIQYATNGYSYTGGGTDGSAEYTFVEATTEAVVCGAGLSIYVDGLTVADYSEGWDVDEDSPPFTIGAQNDITYGISQFVNCKAQVIAWYSTILTTEQIVAITTAVNAL